MNVKARSNFTKFSTCFHWSNGMGETCNRDVRSNNIAISLKILKGRNLLRYQEERRKSI